jgi:hypothetical protein
VREREQISTLESTYLSRGRSCNIHSVQEYFLWIDAWAHASTDAEGDRRGGHRSRGCMRPIRARPGTDVPPTAAQGMRALASAATRALAPTQCFRPSPLPQPFAHAQPALVQTRPSSRPSGHIRRRVFFLCVRALTRHVCTRRVHTCTQHALGPNTCTHRQGANARSIDASATACQRASLCPRAALASA